MRLESGHHVVIGVYTSYTWCYHARTWCKTFVFSPACLQNVEKTPNYFVKKLSCRLNFHSVFSNQSCARARAVPKNGPCARPRFISTWDLCEIEGENALFRHKTSPLSHVVACHSQQPSNHFTTMLCMLVHSNKSFPSSKSVSASPLSISKHILQKSKRKGSSPTFPGYI